MKLIFPKRQDLNMKIHYFAKSLLRLLETDTQGGVSSVAPAEVAWAVFPPSMDKHCPLRLKFEEQIQRKPSEEQIFFFFKEA